MTTPRLLITGSTGKTGTPVVEQLLERAYPVRALAHRLDARSQRLAALGAEVVVGDFTNLQSIRAAMQGVTRVYFCYPPQGDRLLEAATNVAIAAQDEGIEGLVNMSQISAREPATSPLAFQHWQSEQVLDWANIGAAHIKPTFFAEDLSLFTGRSIVSESTMYLPFGEGSHAPVAAEDIARVVVGMLADPAPHVGQHYVVTGPKNMTMAEMAAVLSAELGKPIAYVNLPIARWRQILVEQVGLPESLVTHLAAVAQDHQDGVFEAVTDAVERIGGRAPQSLEDFVRAHRAAFTGDPARA
ncbi:MAG: NmrA family NAD(P)-binding protein [Candidatus Tectomicrobia bacterium]